MEPLLAPARSNSALEHNQAAETSVNGLQRGAVTNGAVDASQNSHWAAEVSCPALGSDEAYAAEAAAQRELQRDIIEYVHDEAGDDAITRPPNQPSDGSSPFRFVPSAELYQVDEIRRFAASLNRECLTEESFALDLKSASSDFDPVRLSRTLHRVEFWREILELSLYKRSLRDLVIRGEPGIKELEDIDNFYAQVSSSGHELMLNLAISELFHLPPQFGGTISAVVRSRCRAIMKTAVNALQREYHYNSTTQKFVGPDGHEVDIETHVPFRSRYRAECKPLSGETLSKSERKLLAAYRVLGKEIGRLKQEIALLRAVTEVEERLPARAVDAALDKVAGVTQHLSDIEPNRLALRYYLHRRVRDGMRDLYHGLRTVNRLSGVEAVHSARWIKQSDLTLPERAKLSYLHLRHGEYSSLLTKIAVGQALFMLTVGLTQFAGQHLPSVLPFVRTLPVFGSLFQFAEQPITKLAATIILLGAIDLVPNAIIKWQSRKLARFLK